MRHMSFFATQQQMRDKTKTETSREGWHNLRVGDVLWAIEKGQGLKKGEHVKRIGKIRVTAHGWAPLNTITQDAVIREGFPHWTPEQFVEFYCQSRKVTPDHIRHWIRFEHLED